jgi:uncharacterized protein (TIGR04255 family)
MARRPAFKFDLAESFPHLPSAPIVEAVIHWTARAGKELQPDELKNQLRERLADYPECQPVGLLQLEAAVSAEGASESRRASWHGFRLTSSDKLHIVQFNRDGLIFSRLQPYKKWKNFSTEGLRLWGIFLELSQPSEVQRLGVRFINRISPITAGEIRDYLKNPPECLDALGLPMDAFLFQTTQGVPKSPFQFNVTQTFQPSLPPQNQGGLIFDIDVFTTQRFPCEDKILKDHLAKMRWLKNKAFFDLMTNDAIEKFKRTKP